MHSSNLQGRKFLLLFTEYSERSDIAECVLFTEYSERSDSMGAGASKDGEEVEVDDRYVSQSQSGSASGPTSPRPRSERKSVGQVRKPSRMSMSRNAGK